MTSATATNRRQYLRRVLGECLATVTGITHLTFAEIENTQVRFPKGAYRMGPEDFTPNGEPGQNGDETGTASFLVAVDFDGTVSAVLDETADAIVERVEIACKRFPNPPPYQGAENTVTILRIDRTNVLPVLDRQGKEGRVLFPVQIIYRQLW